MTLAFDAKLGQPGANVPAAPGRWPPMMSSTSTTAHASEPPRLASVAPGFVRPTFARVYETEFAFVWRSARRLGVRDAHLDDVVQETFLVVHRRLLSFDGRSSLRTWVFGVLRHAVRDYRRTLRRRPGDSAGVEEGLDGVEDRGVGPHASAVAAEGLRLLHALLNTLDDDRREVFVLAELEQMSVPEIAAATGANPNTVYTRLRAARGQFEAELARRRAGEAGGAR